MARRGRPVQRVRQAKMVSMARKVLLAFLGLTGLLVLADRWATRAPPARPGKWVPLAPPDPPERPVRPVTAADRALPEHLAAWVQRDRKAIPDHLAARVNRDL